MAEKKKRFRPTVTAYRALEDENSKLKEEIARLKQFRNDLVPLEKYNEVLAKNKVLEQSNTLMEAELGRLQRANIQLGKMVAKFSNELLVIKSRGFWARVFNL